VANEGLRGEMRLETNAINQETDEGLRDSHGRKRPKRIRTELPRWAGAPPTPEQANP